MFEARLKEGFLLKKLADALKELVEEANFCVGANSLNMHAMDKSHVCLVAMDLKSDLFDHFRCDKPMTMGINVVNLCKMLKCAGNTDTITLKAEDDGDKLTLMYEPHETNKKQDKVSEFELKLLSIDSEALIIPNQNFDAVIKMPSHAFQDVIKDMQTVGETVQISTVKGLVKFATSGDVGSATVCIRENQSNEKPEEDVTIELEEPVSLQFALRFLHNFSKGGPLCNTVVLSLSKDMPISVAFELSEGNGSLRYFLAPKIDDEDEMEDVEAESKPVK